MEQAEILIRLRKEKGLSQAEVAEELGVTRQAVSRWEGGRAWPSMENLAALSRVYGVTVEELVREGAGQKPAMEPEKITPEEAMREPEKKEKRGISGRVIWHIAAAACFCGGVLLWGKLTNSMGTAKMILEFGAFLALSGWLLRNLGILFFYYKNKKGDV